MTSKTEIHQKNTVCKRPKQNNIRLHPWIHYNIQTARFTDPFPTLTLILFCLSTTLEFSVGNKAKKFRRNSQATTGKEAAANYAEKNNR